MHGLNDTALHFSFFDSWDTALNFGLSSTAYLEFLPSLNPEGLQVKVQVCMHEEVHALYCACVHVCVWVCCVMERAE